MDLKAAQQRYSEMLIAAIVESTPAGGRILDIGCGTGHLLCQLLDRGFEVDGVIPDDYLEQRVRARLAARADSYQPQVFNKKFEVLEPPAERYDLLLFSESFQYIPYEKNLALWPQLLKPNGRVLICDFFKSENRGDGGPGDGTFRGGHIYKEFCEYLERQRIQVLRNDDITSNTSPSIGLLNDLLVDRVRPAILTLDSYLNERRPWLLRLVKFFFRRFITRMDEKYFSGHRSKAVFERYKTYRLMVLQPPG